MSTSEVLFHHHLYKSLEIIKTGLCQKYEDMTIYDLSQFPIKMSLGICIFSNLLDISLVDYDWEVECH